MSSNFTKLRVNDSERLSTLFALQIMILFIMSLIHCVPYAVYMYFYCHTQWRCFVTRKLKKKVFTMYDNFKTQIGCSAYTQ